MKITALLENTAPRKDILPEHGLSLYIETKNRKILFDMGQTERFAQNAALLGIDLTAVDTAVLSHGHYDHGGGLKRFLEINQTAPVYLSSYAFEPHYHGAQKYIGLNTALENNNRLIFTDGITAIDTGFTLYSCNDKEKNHSLGSCGLYTYENGTLIPDDFRHEQYLLIEENKKKILFSGCSHKGILDIVRWFQPDVLIGGFHFSKLPLDETLKGFAQYLNQFQTKYYTCHCTGVEQFAFMKNYMGRLHYLSCGESIYV